MSAASATSRSWATTRGCIRTHFDGRRGDDPDAPPMGLWLRLHADFDVSLIHPGDPSRHEARRVKGSDFEAVYTGDAMPY